MQTEMRDTVGRANQFAIAPMMEWTDRHCRVFHRLITRRALLYTEMLATGAVIHGDREKLLGFSPEEHPVALQLGGSDPDDLAEAARIGAAFGYDEINLNCGCPSDRVQSGRFGACLMAEPDLVAEGVAAMKAAVDVPVTVKCRIGIDDQDPEPTLFGFAEKVMAASADRLVVHARKAWLKGLSPKENRNIPPLDYDLVYRLKATFPTMRIILNGGIGSLDEAEMHLKTVDGVMLGRAAYHNPWLLSEVDARLFGEARSVTREQVLATMIEYAERQLDEGVRLNSITRHMLGLYHGQPGARAYRRHLTVEAIRPGAGIEVLTEARDRMREIADRRDRQAA